MMTDSDLKLLSHELNENPYRKFRLAFLLISVIPLLTLAYLISEQYSIQEGFVSIAGILLILVVVIIALGYILAYRMIRNVLSKTLAYATRAKRSDELKSTFALSMAHDLKSPLMVIKANLSNMKAGFLGKLTDDQDKAIDVCREVTSRMDAMILELLDTYKIEAGIAELKTTHFDFKEIVTGQERELESLYNAKHVTFSVELPKKALMVVADREKLVRVVNNLITNSIKYTPEGGTISVKVHAAAGFIRAEFINNGPAIPTNKIDKIFDKFERLDKTVEGQGLGLSIAKDIIELHRGRIWAESVPGKYNRFTVLLPLAQ